MPGLIFSSQGFVCPEAAPQSPTPTAKKRSHRATPRPRRAEAAYPAYPLCGDRPPVRCIPTNLLILVSISVTYLFPIDNIAQIPVVWRGEPRANLHLNPCPTGSTGRYKYSANKWTGPPIIPQDGQDYDQQQKSSAEYGWYGGEWRTIFTPYFTHACGC